MNETSRTFVADGNVYLRVEPPECKYFTFSSPRGPIASILMSDGSVTLGEGYTPEGAAKEAADLFWKHFGERVQHNIRTVGEKTLKEVALAIATAEGCFGVTNRGERILCTDLEVPVADADCSCLCAAKAAIEAMGIRT